MIASPYLVPGGQPHAANARAGRRRVIRDLHAGLGGLGLVKRGEDGINVVLVAICCLSAARTAQRLAGMWYKKVCNPSTLCELRTAGHGRVEQAQQFHVQWACAAHVRCVPLQEHCVRTATFCLRSAASSSRFWLRLAQPSHLAPWPSCVCPFPCPCCRAAYEQVIDGRSDCGLALSSGPDAGAFQLVSTKGRTIHLAHGPHRHADTKQTPAEGS